MRILLVLLLAACDDRTSALIDIQGAMPLSSLDLTITLPGRPLHRALGALTPPRKLLILLPDVTQQIDLSLAGIEEGGRAVAAQATFQSKPRQQVTLTMSLSGPGDDLSMAQDLAGADLTGFVEDLASADLQVQGDLAGADLSVVPTLTILAGMPGSLNTYDATGRDARFSFLQQPALVGTSLYVFELFSGKLRKVDVTTGEATTLPLINAADSQPFLAADPVGLVSDGQGHLYFSGQADHTIRKVNLADFKVSIVAGAANTPGSTDSPPRFNEPLGLALDGNGDLWVADSGNYTVRKIALAGPTVTTPAGSPGVSDFADGVGAAGHFLAPKGLAFQNGDLYVVDGDGLRKLVPSPSPAPLTTVVAQGTWTNPRGVASAGGGTLYVAELSLNTVRRVTLGPPVSQTVVAGMPGFTQDFVDGMGSAARFVQPNWLVLDGAGAAYLAEVGSIRKIDLGNYNVTTLAGMSPLADNSDSPRARLNGPTGMVYDGSDVVYIADYANNRIRRLTLSTNLLTTVAGSGDYLSVDGNGLGASFGSPVNVTRDGSGNLYVADLQGHCIRKINSNLDVVTVAGVPNMPGLPSPSPVPGTLAHVTNPDGMAFDGDHTLYFTDGGNHALRALDLTSGDVSWLAGSGTPGDGVGIGRAAQFNDPHGLVWDGANKILYVADYGTGIIRKVDMTNPALPNVSNLTGTPFASTFSDGTFANATFGGPAELALDAARNVLWVADSGNHAVRRLDLTAKTVTSPIGTPRAAFTKPGPLPAFVARPWGVVVTPLGIVVSSWDENTVLLATF